MCRGGPSLWENVVVSNHMGTGYPGAPPGWYPDPAGGPGQRWWDGYSWTEATVLPQHPPPPPWANAAPPLGAPTEEAPWAVASERLNTFNTTGHVNDEMYLVPAARVAVAIPAVYCIVALIMVRVNASQLRSVGHQFRQDYHYSQLGQTPPPYHGGSGLNPLMLIAGLLTVAAIVVACVWQHRAAGAGRALGIPSNCSPAWGVGSWFVPVVNLRIPYTAVRDCLPVGHPARARVLQWWIAGLLAGWLTFAAYLCAFSSSTAALVVSIPAALAALAVVALSPGIVSAIAASHRDAMAQVATGTGAPVPS